MTYLLDANVLIALLVTDHVHHRAARIWLASTDEQFATCPITEGSAVRFLLRRGQTGPAAQAVIGSLADLSRREFWEDALSYTDLKLSSLMGHRQVTDAYLVALAKARGGKLVTFDRGVATHDPSVVEVLTGA